MIFPLSILIAGLIFYALWRARWRIGLPLLALFRPRRTPQPVKPLDYAQPDSWYIHPRLAAEKCFVTLPSAEETVNQPAALFFIHPTSFLSVHRWNQVVHADSRDLLLEQILLPQQLGVFGADFARYAPKYPQANFTTFATTDPAREQALEIATRELLRAFAEFLAEIGERPFILAGHSQGAYHAVAILARRIIGTPLQDRLIAAYTPGYFIPESTFAENGLPLCRSRGETGCLQIWNAVGSKHRLPPGIARMPQPVGTRGWGGNDRTLRLHQSARSAAPCRPRRRQPRHARRSTPPAPRGNAAGADRRRGTGRDIDHRPACNSPSELAATHTRLVSPA